MNLPLALQTTIETLLEGKNLRVLSQHREELSERYRSNSSAKMDSAGTRLSYLATRMPATYAAIVSALGEIQKRDPLLKISSLLDLGSGPGTALWAVREVFPELSTATLLEQDRELITLGKHLAKACHISSSWIQADLTSSPSFTKNDMVVLSYSLGELPTDKRSPLVQKAWESTNKIFVCIEPGTPRGFEVIRSVREQCLKMGAQMIAPCPHALQCPMEGNNWCHFSVRLERSTEHRKLKDAELGYEDEKFSYVAFTREKVELPEARILRHPQKHSGHVEFTLCTQNGLEKVNISKKQGELYKLARKLSWGQTLDEY